jgi:hypothetical protein
MSAEGTAGMSLGSREFLLKEYEEVFTFLRHVLTAQDRAVALYLALLSAIAAWVSQLPTDPAALRLVLGPPGRPWSFWLVAMVLFLGVSATLHVLLTRWWALSVEYTSTLNRIRAAFEADDPQITPFLTLPRRVLWAASPGRGRAQATVSLFVSCLAGLGAGAGLYRVLWSLDLHYGCVWAGSVLWGALWVGTWQRYRSWYNRRSDKERGRPAND